MMAASTSQQQPRLAFKQLLTAFSVWYDENNYLSMLKVLYKDLVKDMNKLSKASGTMELMNLLIASGNLNSTDLTILYDTIKATDTFGLEEKIKHKIPSCPNIRDVEITKFTPYRLKVMKLGLALRDEDVVKISELYNEPTKEYVDPWGLIIDLEIQMILCEREMEEFIENLKERRLFNAVQAVTEGVPITVSLVEVKKHPKYPLKLLKDLNVHKDCLAADDTKEFLSIFRELASYYITWGLDLKKLKGGSFIFYLSACDSKALHQLWEIHSRKILIQDLAKILVQQEHQHEFLDEWKTYIDPKNYEAALSLCRLKENGGSPLGLPDKNLKKLSVKIKDWYALAIELEVDEDFMEEVRSKAFTSTESCVLMLTKWREACRTTMQAQVVKLIETLREMNDEQKAIRYLSELLTGPSVMQIADFTKKDADSKPIVHGSTYFMQEAAPVERPAITETEMETTETQLLATAKKIATHTQIAKITEGPCDISIEGRSKIKNIAGSGNQSFTVSDQSDVGNIATNTIAKNFVQATIQSLTDEQREEQLNIQAKEKGPTLLKDLQAQLKNQYKRAAFTEFTPSQWSKHKIDIQDLFTDMIMFQNPNSGNEKKAKEIKIDDIATPYKKKKDGANDPKRILIQGELGNGKTTLMKRLARSWADDPNKGVFGEKIVFFLELKNMRKKSFLENVIEISLPKDCLKKFKVTLQVLQRVIIQNDKNFVFLCDGYDELFAGMGSELEEVFKRNELNESVLVVTTRPDNMDKLVKVCESHIKIRGFKPERQDEYIEKFFKDDPDQGQNLIKLRNDKQYNHIFEMARTPLFLFFLCTLWKVKGQVPSTVIELYRELLVCKVNQFLGKQESRKIDKFSQINPEHFDAMLYVGRVTLDGLFENRLNIKQNELTDEKQTLVASKLGLIFEETNVSELDHMKCYTTTHKSESEFLASLYVAETMKKGSKDYIGQIVTRMLSTSELSQVCKFTVALLGNKAHLFMDYFPLEDFKSSALADLLDECPEGEVQIVKDSIKDRMNKVKYVTIKSQTGLKIVEELNNFKRAVTCKLDTSSANIRGSDIPKALYSMTALSSLTWHGIIDETLENFPIFGSTSLESLSKISLQGKLTKKNSCSNLGSFLYNLKAMETLELPVISYGPGLYTFVSAMYGHNCSGDDPTCTNRPQSNFDKMTTLTFVLKRTFSKGQRNSGYAYLVSRIMALCPSLSTVNSHETNEEFEFHLFRNLTKMETFRDRQKPEVSLPNTGDLECYAFITLPTNDYKNCVSILFRKYNAIRINSRSTSTTLSLRIVAHQIDCKLQFTRCQLMSIPVQTLSNYLDTDVSESLHLSWYRDFLPQKKQNFEEINFISQLMAKHKGLVLLSLPCEALTKDKLSSGNKWMVKHIEFTCKEINPRKDKCKEYMKQITGYLLHISSIKTLTIPPFRDAFTHLHVLSTAEFPLDFVNKLLISGSQTPFDDLTFELLARLIGQLPEPWFNQMDVDREGTISFSLPTKREYKDNGSKYTVTRIKDGLQRKINCTMISFCFGLRGLAPCRILQLVDQLRKERLHVDKLFIFPGLVFANPYALHILFGLEKLNEIKMVLFSNKTYADLRELHMVKNNALKVFYLSGEELTLYVKNVSGSAPTVRHYLSNVSVNQVEKKKVTDLSTVLPNDSNALVFRIVDYFNSPGEVDKLVRLCDQKSVNCRSVQSLAFENEILLKGTQAVTLLKCFPNLQKLNLSGLHDVQPFFEEIINEKLLCRELLTELGLGNCGLNFPNCGTSIAKLLFRFRNLQVFRVTPIENKMSASVFKDMVHHVDSQRDSIHKHLQVLSFGEFKFDETDADIMGGMFGRLLFHFPELQSLDMSMFRIGKSSLHSFITKLNDETFSCELGLRHLDLSGHNFKSGEMARFLTALKVLPKLSELRLEMCRISDNPGCLLERICTFSKIDLSRCHFKKADHKKIFVAQVLRSATIDTKLRLVTSNEGFLNSLGEELVSSGIATALGYLDISNSKLPNVNFKLLLLSLTQLKTLILKGCDIDAGVLKGLVTAIKNERCTFASGLTTLDMSSSKFNEAVSGHHLASVLEIFPALQILRLSSCHITKAVMETFLMELKGKLNLELHLRSLVLLDNDITSLDTITLQVARYLPLDCKLKVKYSKISGDASAIILQHSYFDLDRDNDGNIIAEDDNDDSDEDNDDSDEDV